MGVGPLLKQLAPGHEASFRSIQHKMPNLRSKRMIDPTHFDRRSMLGSIAALLGVAALPAEALAASVQTRRYLPRFRFALLSAVADTILPTTDTPGALVAKVPERLDAMLRDWAAPATREDMIGALSRIDAAAQKAKGKGFAALTAPERAEVLREHDKAALKSAPRADGSKPMLFDFNAVPTDPGYKRVKDLVILLHFYSPTGSEHELVYEHVPGPFEPSIKLAAGARPYLSIGPV